MQSWKPKFGFACTALGALAVGAAAQSPVSGLPPAQPTALATAAPQKPLSADQLPSHHAVVRYESGRLTVEANNSSLNQILWAIGQKMQLKITGGVVEERVYGSYGPGDPARILTVLLDGTGSNMLLKESGKPGSSALILTPRAGGIMPPSPGPGPDVADEPRTDLPPAPIRTRADFLADPATHTPAIPASAAAVSSSAPSPAAATGTMPQSPNGVKTPEQIYQQLLKMQQQTQQTPKPPQ